MEGECSERCNWSVKRKLEINRESGTLVFDRCVACTLSVSVFSPSARPSVLLFPSAYNYLFFVVEFLSLLWGFLTWSFAAWDRPNKTCCTLIWHVRYKCACWHREHDVCTHPPTPRSFNSVGSTNTSDIIKWWTITWIEGYTAEVGLLDVRMPTCFDGKET